MCELRLNSFAGRDDRRVARILWQNGVSASPNIRPFCPRNVATVTRIDGLARFAAVEQVAGAPIRGPTPGTPPGAEGAVAHGPAAVIDDRRAEGRGPPVTCEGGAGRREHDFSPDGLAATKDLMRSVPKPIYRAMTKIRAFVASGHTALTGNAPLAYATMRVREDINNSRGDREQCSHC